MQLLSRKRQTLSYIYIYMYRYDHTACSTQSQMEGFYFVPAFLGHLSGGAGQIFFFFHFTMPCRLECGQHRVVKSGPIPEAPAIQKGSPCPVAVEVTVAPVFTQCGTSQRIAWWGRRGGLYTAVYKGEPGQKLGFR